MHHTYALLTNEQADFADRLATAQGISLESLIQKAGLAVADRACCTWPKAQRFLILTGPGHNGDDGKIAAAILRQRNREVICLPHTYEGELPHRDVIIDALYGAGLSRAIEGPAAHMIAQVNSSNCPVLSVDVPSGLDGSSGQPTGPVIQATATQTFFSKKTGHLLIPGRHLCGDVYVADIGIPVSVLESIKPMAWQNTAEMWRDHLPHIETDSHKYMRGHALCLSGGIASTGASRLAAKAALRVGAGLVTLLCPPEALPIQAASLTAVMVKPYQDCNQLINFIAQRPINAVLVGPGFGQGETSHKTALACLGTGCPTVLDADALTCWPDPEELRKAIHSQSRPVILTPHQGEFRRLADQIPEITQSPSKLEQARSCAAYFGAVVVLKGADTVIASPDGRAAINDHAPPWLATAGSGDVLAGLLTGLMAQQMPAFQAACYGVWLHGDAGYRAGHGMIAEDLDSALHQALRNMS